jgi:hypothetical protein
MSNSVNRPTGAWPKAGGRAAATGVEFSFGLSSVISGYLDGPCAAVEVPARPAFVLSEVGAGSSSARPLIVAESTKSVAAFTFAPSRR